MSDIRCPVCAEPWDAYGVHHGDMLPWERDLFKRGAGCPCCKGVTPFETAEARDEVALAHASDVLVGMAWDDPDSFACASVLVETRPAWERPEPVALWTCAGCKVSAGKSVDDPRELEWFGGESVHYRYGLAYVYGESSAHDEPDEEPSHTIAGETYCPGCATTCAECSGSVFSGFDGAQGDPYAEGYGVSHPGNPFWGLVCLGCYESEMTCGDCGEMEHAGGGGCACA